MTDGGEGMRKAGLHGNHLIGHIKDFVDPPISRSWTSAMVTVRELYERMNVRLFDRWHLGAPKTDKFVHLYRRGKGV